MIESTNEVDAGENHEISPEEIDQLRQEIEQTYPDYTQQLLFSTDISPQERQTFWHNAKHLDELLAQSVSQLTSPLEDISQITLIIDQALEQINPASERFAGLTHHLEEVTNFTHEMLFQDRKVRFSDVISVETAQTLAGFVAPNHDKLKFLSKPEGQIMPDHEHVTAYMLRKHFGDMPAIADQVKQAASVIQDHENIFKEEGRDTFITSENQTERAKALFFIADVLTGVIAFDQDPATIDQQALEQRFTDLYFRHIDLKAGKVYRPEWGLHAIRDVIATLKHLQNHHQFQIEPHWSHQLTLAALKAVDQAKRGDNFFSQEQEQRLKHAELMLGWSLPENERNETALSQLLLDANKDRWPNVPKATIHRAIADQPTDLGEVCQHLDQIEAIIKPALNQEATATNLLDLARSPRAADSMNILIDAPDSSFAKKILNQYPLFRLLIEHTNHSQLTTQDYPRETSPLPSQYDRTLANKAMVEVTKSFQHYARHMPENIIFQHPQLSDLLYLSMLHLDVAKGGTPELREYLANRKDIDFLAHNRASAMLVQEEKPLQHYIVEQFNATLSQDQQSTLHQLMIQMIKHHGLVGQYIRGEVTQHAFEELSTWVWQQETQLDTLIAALYQDQDIKREDFISQMYHLVNCIDTKSVRPDLMTPQLYQQFEEFNQVFHSVLKPVDQGQAPNWSDVASDTIHKPEYSHLSEVDQVRLGLADRLSRLRGGQDYEECLGTLLELPSTQIQQIADLLQHSQLWYTENATSFLSAQNQLKIITLLANRSRKNAASDANIDLNFAPLMNTLRPAGESNPAYAKVLDVYLHNLTVDYILENTTQTDQNGTLPLSGANGAQAFLEIHTQSLADEPNTSYSIDLKLDPTIRHSLNMIASYYQSENRADIAIIASAINVLKKELGLSLDEWDRLFDQELYMIDMNSSMPEKQSAIMPIIEQLRQESDQGLTIVGVGSGTGVLEIETARQLGKSDTIVATDISRTMVEHIKRSSRVIAAHNFLVENHLKDGNAMATLKVFQADATSPDFASLLQDQVGDSDMVMHFSVIHEFASFLDNYSYGSTVDAVFENALKVIANTNGIEVLRDFILPPGMSDEDTVAISFGKPKEGEQDPVEFAHKFLKEFPGYTLAEREELGQALNDLDPNQPNKSITISAPAAYELYAHYSWLGQGKNQKELQERYAYKNLDQYREYFQQLADKLSIKAQIQMDIQPGSYSKHIGHAMKLDIDQELVNMAVITIKAESTSRN